MDLNIPNTFSSSFLSCSGEGGGIYLVSRCLEGCFQAASFAGHCAHAEAVSSRVPRQPGQYGTILGRDDQRPKRCLPLGKIQPQICFIPTRRPARLPFLVALADTPSQVWDLGLQIDVQIRIVERSNVGKALLATAASLRASTLVLSSSGRSAITRLDFIPETGCMKRTTND